MVGREKGGRGEGGREGMGEATRATERKKRERGSWSS